MGRPAFSKETRLASIKAAHARYRAKNRAEINRRQRETSKVKQKEWYLKKKYGMSPQDLERLLVEQEGLCAICARAIQDDPHIDHNHNSGKVRGLLCHHCNVGLGNFQDSAAILEKAKEYLAERS